MWEELRHQNILPFYGMYISRALPWKGSHGWIGIVTDIEPRIHMVSGQSRVQEREVDSSTLGITMAGKRKPA